MTVTTFLRVVHSNVASVLGQLLIIAWMVGLQLHLLGTFGKSGGVALGIVLTALTAALFTWTVRLITSEVRSTTRAQNEADADDSRQGTIGRLTQSSDDADLELVTQGDETAGPTEIEVELTILSKKTTSTEQ